MSDVSVDIIKNRSGEAPDLPSGANLSGVSTAATLQVTNLNPTHINASGVTTATTFSGSLKSTGTPTLGLGVTINSSGINISGVATAGIVSATTLYGDGSNLTGVAMSIAPISYQPDVNDSLVSKSNVSIGMTFTERVIAGSGNITLRLVGAAGTVVENFGVGSSVTINNNEVSVTPTAALLKDTVYHINYPSGSFTNTGGDVSYVGTAYTFAAAPLYEELWAVGDGGAGQFGLNNTSQYSSPVQVPGNNWSRATGADNTSFGIKTDGTLWAWGYNLYGALGQNQPHDGPHVSSPIQIPGTTWSSLIKKGRESQEYAAGAIKTDGTLWVWGGGYYGSNGLNANVARRSSPTQLPGTTWRDITAAQYKRLASKTDGTLWAWGLNNEGALGQNAITMISSPAQIPGTTWTTANWIGTEFAVATKTDGTLWTWGRNEEGALGHNNLTKRSSPTQVPGTNWGITEGTVVGGYNAVFARKTDGTLWAWGRNQNGQLGLNSTANYSSPAQIPGTNWAGVVTIQQYSVKAWKTDGTLWAWGAGNGGRLGVNDTQDKSSPVQIPGTDWVLIGSGGPFMRKDA